MDTFIVLDSRGAAIAQDMVFVFDGDLDGAREQRDKMNRSFRAGLVDFKVFPLGAPIEN